MRKRIILLCVLFLIIWPAALSAEGEWGLQAGMQAPDFTAVDHHGEEVTLSKFYKKKPVVLIFYRGGWCPYCNRHLHAFQEHAAEFQDEGVTLLAVSVDTPENAAQTVTKDELDFRVISNPDAEVLDLYNLAYEVPAELVKMYKEKHNIDLEQSSGQTHHIIAIPAVFIIDRAGTIVYSYANEDYKVRKDPQEILAILQEGAIGDQQQFKRIRLIKHYVLGFGPWAFVVYVLLYTLNTMTLLPPILFMTLAGGAIFGPLVGSIAIMLGCLFGTTATFFISRFLGRRFVEKVLKGKARDFEEKLNKKGFLAILVMRLLAFPPWEAVNYLAGLTKIKYRDFFWGTFFGIIPAIVVQVYLADRAINLDLQDHRVIAQLGAAIVAFILLANIQTIYKKFKGDKS